MKKIYFIVLIVILLMTFTGCATVNGISTSAAKKAIKNGEWGIPATHTLLFGITGKDIHKTSVLLQQNPDIGYNFIHPYMVQEQINIISFLHLGKNRFFLSPHPTGAEFKEFLWTKETNNILLDDKVTKFIYEGIGGVDFQLTKPGLQFYNVDDSKHTQELKTLKKIAKYFKGSEWGDLINSRIEEISNDK